VCWRLASRQAGEQKICRLVGLAAVNMVWQTGQ
jgi:hypothetical protein